MRGHDVGPVELRRSRLSRAVQLTTLILAGAGPAVAQTEAVQKPSALPVWLSYRAPATCPDRAAFYTAVRARTARVRAARPGEDAHTFVVVILSGEGSTTGHLRVTYRGQDTDSREVQGANCEEVVEALSLTAALSVDPDALLSRPTEPPTSRPPPSPPPRIRERPTPPPPPVAPRRSPRWWVGADAAFSKALSPFTLWGSGAFIGVQSRAASVFAPTLRFSLHHLRNDLLQSPDTARATLTSITLDSCPVRFGADGHVTVRLCAVAQTGVLYLRGLSVDHPESVTHAWWAAGLLARGSAPITDGVWLQVQGGLSLPLAERRFFTDVPHREVAYTPGVAASGSLALAIQLP